MLLDDEVPRLSYDQRLYHGPAGRPKDRLAKTHDLLIPGDTVEELRGRQKADGTYQGLRTIRRLVGRGYFVVA